MTGPMMMRRTNLSIETLYEDYIHKSRYARYLPDKGRREEWTETVDRYMEFMYEHLKNKYDYTIPDKLYKELSDAIENKEVMPSMRALMTAGPALERDHVAGYNCAYVPVDDPKVFDEIMYILLCGTGVGFSVERKYIEALPTVAETLYPAEEDEAHITFLDSKKGWAAGYRKLVSLLYSGCIPTLDYSRIRPHGAPLKTFGGRASGPEPLKELCDYTISIFKRAAGRRLTSIECHDIVCKIAEAIVCGGVRRSALISLSNLTDSRMAGAKTGQWYVAEPQRALANNSVAYTERPDIGMFLNEWGNLYASKSGERGIFSRVAAKRQVPDRRDRDFEFGTNPCSEIILRPRQFCNLTEVVARPHDTLASLVDKVRLATILGTFQSTLTDFKYISKKWKANCEEERLLGVSLTGIMDCPLLYDLWDELFDGMTLADRLSELKNEAISVNKTWAAKLKIPRSAAITCVKPSGTVSQLVGSSSGIHPRYAEFYIRRVRGDIKDPVSIALKDAGVPCEVDVMNPGAYVFSFPMRSPAGSITIKDLTALQQLQLWSIYNRIWCEHKPSVSIYVKEHEWIEVADWVYKNFDDLSGISFFPSDDHVYKQAPYEEITEDEYKERAAAFPDVMGLELGRERIDNTTSSQELACAGGACEL